MSKPYVVAGIQCRMGSTRLPGKSMMDLGGAPLIQRVLERVHCARGVDRVWMVPASTEADVALQRFLESLGASVLPGHPTDVRARYLALIEQERPGLVVRICGDCPFVRPEVIDRMVELAIASDADLTYGETGVDVFKPHVIAEDGSEYAREHVLGRFAHSSNSLRIAYLREPGEDRHEEKWSIDTVEDLARARERWARGVR